MRLSPISIAITLTLLGACSQKPTRVEAQAPVEPMATADAGVVESSADASTISNPVSSTNSITNSSAKASRDKMRQAPSDRRSAELASVALPSPTLAFATPPPAPPAANMGVVSDALAESNTEHYQEHADNAVQQVADNPVSTFSIDVDTGSYSNVRRMLVAGERPPADAVRAEEMLNYFDYGYSAPATKKQPFLVSTELAAAPWNSRHQLLQIGIQGYRVPAASIPASNIVFLVDTSGSMQAADKLPLLKESLRAMIGRMRAQDRVSLVVYAGSAGLVLPPTPGDQHERILAALDQLEAGGSTNGGQGLQLAYAMAKQAFIANGVNRVVLATDGDFNVGNFNQQSLETMIADQRKSGVALTTLGFGTGNYNDAMAEQLADIGNGNHAYIDSVQEGRKVLVEELTSTMLTIAQDVKIQVEFNPAVVAEYRLIGYENRALRREDFNNDKVDAGEIGAGHDVTALYEVTLVGSGGESVSPLRYGKASAAGRAGGDEIALLRLRYKQPGSSTSQLIERPLLRSALTRAPSQRLRWAAAVAAYADLLRGGKNVGAYDWSQVRALAAGAVGEDRWGYRAEFVSLVDRARLITGEHPLVVSE